jgi:nucleoid-associated protein YgaU
MAGTARPTNMQIGRYWQRLMTANRDHVVDPDLIYAGQILDLPPIDPP